MANDPWPHGTVLTPGDQFKPQSTRSHLPCKWQRDTGDNHINIQVQAPKTYQAPPFMNTLHGWKMLLLILFFVCLFSKFWYIPRYWATVNVIQWDSTEILLFRVYSMGNWGKRQPVLCIHPANTSVLLPINKPQQEQHSDKYNLDFWVLWFNRRMEEFSDEAGKKTQKEVQLHTQERRETKGGEIIRWKKNNNNNLKVNAF